MQQSSVTDPYNFCSLCFDFSGSPGQDRCTGITLDSCCNVYVNDMCDSDCPDDGVYTIDPTTFQCRNMQNIENMFLPPFH